MKDCLCLESNTVLTLGKILAWYSRSPHLYNIQGIDSRSSAQQVAQHMAMCELCNGDCLSSAYSFNHFITFIVFGGHTGGVNVHHHIKRHSTFSDAYTCKRLAFKSPA
jgi:hypothetical protein